MENNNPEYQAVQEYCEAFGLPVSFNTPHPDEFEDYDPLAIVGYGGKANVEFSIWLDGSIIFADFGTAMGPCGVRGVQPVDEEDIELAIESGIAFDAAKGDWFSTARRKKIGDLIKKRATCVDKA